ncbi:putative major facilitator superfamily, MFS transporter superfamily [Septoria linicola]|nr:putative major facilitator superfamily, MFS transporter superfamily [Septoria linicola]
MSDKYGRRPVVLMGCIGTIASLLVVGFAPNFWIALLGRCLAGALNGNVGVIQTMVGEIVVNPKHEPKAYAVMPFVWSVGTILGPSIGGLFAEPVDNYPQYFHKGGMFDKFPYLLPNLICSALMLVSVIAGYFLLMETHPDHQPWSTPQDLEETTAETPMLPAQAGLTTSGANLMHESYGTFNPVDEEAVEEEWDLKADGTSRTPSQHSREERPKVFTRRVIMLTVALGIFTYHSMTYDHLTPIFFQDERVPSGGRIMRALAAGPAASPYGSLAGGLGLSVRDTGVILSFNGIIALVVQALIFPLIVTCLGTWKTFMMTAIGHPLAYFVVPYLALLPANWLYPGIYAALSIRNFFSIIAYPVLLILIKEASPSPRCFGKINGLAASVGAGARCLASPVAGYLYSLGMKMDLTAIAWWASAFVALVGTLQAFFINQRRRTPGRDHEYHEHHRVESVVQFLPEHQRHRDSRPSVVRITVHGDGRSSTPDERTPFASRVVQRG